MARASFSYKLKFFFVEPIALGPWLFLILYQNKYMFIFALSVTIFLWFLGNKGLTVMTLSRKVKVFLVGKVRHIRPFWRKEL